MTATSPMPFTARRRGRRTNSASSRSSSNEAPPFSEVSATSMISPVTETVGAISTLTSGGRLSRTR